MTDLPRGRPASLNAGQNTPVPNTPEAIAFLTRMHSDGPFHQVAIHPETGKIQPHTFKVGQREDMARWIDKRQGLTNIYFHVNPLKHTVLHLKAKKIDVAQATYLQIDVDDPAALNRVRQFGPPPTAAVFSGGGFQVFWRLSEPCLDFNLVERLNAAFADELGGDSCHNVDRIMRVPGTINVPNKKKRDAGRTETLAYVIHELTDWNRHYSAEALALRARTSEVSASESVLVPSHVDLEALPLGVSEVTKALIRKGDDPTSPIGKPGARYRSRSEIVYRVVCDLVRADCPDEIIAGILLGDFGISASVREKRDANAYAVRVTMVARSFVTRSSRRSVSILERRTRSKPQTFSVSKTRTTP